MLLKKLQSENPKLISIIEDLKDGFCTINKSGDFIYVNLSAMELLGLTENNQDVNFFDDVIKESKHIVWIENKINNDSYIKDYEIEIYNINLEKIPVLLNINQIKDPGKNIIGLSVLIKDMTYIKRVQQQLLQAQKMESIGMLASGVAHEFNNILTGIIPNAELIKLTTEENNSNYNRADSIQKSAVRAAEIVKKLLNFARDDKSPATRSTDFVKCANETIDIIRKLFDKNIQIESNFPENLYRVKLDETGIQQIIMNLAINAKDAILDKGKISFSAENVDGSKAPFLSNNYLRGNYVLFAVSDNGQGIDKDKIKYIFDPFYTTKKPGQGTGLGLSMVYGIVNSANGSIEVNSRINVGSKFTVLLPASFEDYDENIKEIKNSDSGHGQKIMVIDDEEMIVAMAIDMLRSIGFDAIGFTSGQEAVNQYRKTNEEIDVVLLDLLMPEMNGIICLKELRQINPDVKVIIASGIGEISKKKELEKIGITHYLEKPYSLHDVLEKLNNLIKN